MNINNASFSNRLTEQSFRENLSKLSQADSLVIDSQGNVTPVRPSGVFNLFQRNPSLSNPRLVEFKLMEFLIEGKKWLKPEDMPLVEQLADKSGLTSDKKNHKELSLLVHYISQEVLHQEITPQNDLTYLCKAFQTHHRTTLAPYAELCEQIIQNIANTPSKQYEEIEQIQTDEEEILSVPEQLEDDETDLDMSSTVQEDVQEEVLEPSTNEEEVMLTSNEQTEDNMSARVNEDVIEMEEQPVQKFELLSTMAPISRNYVNLNIGNKKSFLREVLEVTTVLAVTTLLCYKIG